MSDGKYHYKAWRRAWFLPLGACVILAYAMDLSRVISWIFIGAILLGYWLGKYIDPDLDLKTVTETKKRWPTTILVQMYSELAKYLGGHRSILTHMPFVSTAIRFMVIFIMPVAVIVIWLEWLLSGMVSLQLLLRPEITTTLFGLFLGLSLSDTVHFALDLT